MKKLFFVLGLFCVQVMATDLTWVQLSADYMYQDISISCSGSTMFNHIYFVAEIENGKAVQAALKGDPNAVFPKSSIEFTESELGGIEFYKDYFGRFWLKELALTERMVAWAIYELGDYLCRPSRPVKSVTPALHRLYFDTKGLGLEVMTAFANPIEFSGVLDNDKAYEAEIEFMQRLVN